MSNKPTLFAYTVKDHKNRKTIWTPIGAARPRDGFSLKLDALPIDFDGRIVLTVPKAKEAGAQ
jgi:hypothetical protein